MVLKVSVLEKTVFIIRAAKQVGQFFAAFASLIRGIGKISHKNTGRRNSLRLSDAMVFRSSRIMRPDVIDLLAEQME